MTIKQIKEELLDIRMFYREHDFYMAWIKKGIKSKVISLVDKYNNAMENAPVTLLRVYIGLYCEAKTQELLAEDMGYSIHQVNNWNVALLKYLQETLG